MTKIKAVACDHCDFASGRRGMDSCGKCGGTGSQLVVTLNGETRRFPNTKEGDKDARKFAGEKP